MSGTRTDNTNFPFDTDDASTGSQESNVYPPQRHAGKVSYGPQYHLGPTFGEKIKGYEEELKGHLTHDPALTEHGKQLASGEIKRRERDQDMNESSAFGNPNEKKSERDGHGKQQAAAIASAGTEEG